MSEAGVAAWSVMCGLMAFVLFIAAVALFIKSSMVADEYAVAKSRLAKYWAYGGIASVLAAVGLVGGAVYLGGLY